MSKLILITGVSRGLGLALAEKFIEEGHTVLGCARNAEKMKELQEKHGNSHSFSPVDVSDSAQVRAWCDRLLSHYNPPDLLINNAGLLNQLNPLWKVPQAEFNAIIDVNIKGVANILRHFLPPMIERNAGIIVNYSSGWGRSTSPEVAPYCATKWAIEGLTRALAQELPSGMAAIPLNPGIIHTDMLEICYGNAAASYTKIQDWVQQAAPFLLNLKPKDNGIPLTVPI